MKRNKFYDGLCCVNPQTKTLRVLAEMAALMLAFGLALTGCPMDNDDPGSVTFTAQTDESTANDEATLGFAGENASSSNPGVATVKLSDDNRKIVIVSVTPGTADITVSKTGFTSAVFTVTVADTGAITIGAITRGGTAVTFTPTADRGTANDEATLGFTGESVSSSNTGVATVEIADGKIVITSVTPGTADITVNAAGFTPAAFTVTVADTGAITIGAITKGKDENAPTITSVTISPDSTTVNRGQSFTFTASVQGTGDPDQTLAWTVEGGVSETSITSGGVLTVGEDETASSLIVRAASTYDTTKSGTATVTVSTITGPIVTGVTVSPDSATVGRGQSFTFTASVQGTDDPDQTITWTVEGGVSETSITSGGVLTVGEDETASSLIVRAASTYNTTKSGTAAVTVPPRGQGTVTLIYPEDAAADAFPDTIVLSAAQTLTVSGEYDLYQWLVDGTITASSKSITLNPADYAAGTHQISVELTRNGVMYSKAGTFTVE
jgi:hypothetical protein